MDSIFSHSLRSPAWTVHFRSSQQGGPKLQPGGPKYLVPQTCTGPWCCGCILKSDLLGSHPPMANSPPWQVHQDNSNLVNSHGVYLVHKTKFMSSYHTRWTNANSFHYCFLIQHATSLIQALPSRNESMFRHALNSRKTLLCSLKNSVDGATALSRNQIM